MKILFTLNFPSVVFPPVPSHMITIEVWSINGKIQENALRTGSVPIRVRKLIAEDRREGQITTIGLRSLSLSDTTI